MNDINFRTITLRDLAAIVNAKFTAHDIQATLVGGACVSIYSNNRYQSYNLDFITFDTRSKVKRALSELGKEKQIAKFEEFLKRLSKENSHKTK